MLRGENPVSHMYTKGRKDLGMEYAREGLDQATPRLGTRWRTRDF